MLLGVQKNVKERFHTLPSELPFWELELNGFPNFQKVIVGVKTHWIEKFLISLESFWKAKFGNLTPNH
jgi:hypothetical protein